MMRRVLLLAALAAACQKPPTELVVVVASDYAVPAELASVAVDIKARDLRILRQHNFRLAEHPLPLSFTVAPGPVYLGDRVVIEVRAVDPAGRSIGLRRAVVGFVPEQRRLLAMFLARQCQAASCEAGQSCTELGCASEDLNVLTLPRIGPGDELDFDGGVPRGVRPDAAVADLGPPDLGVHEDAGATEDAAAPTDAGFMSQSCLDAPCSAGRVCLDIVRGLRCDATSLPEDCECRDTCDPLGPGALSCSRGRTCFWFDRSATDLGACITDRGGAVQGEACTASYDANGTRLGDTCNASRNYVCLGATPARPMGLCARRCRTGSEDLCVTQFIGYQCSADGADGVGLCLLPPPATDDLGHACLRPSDCASGLCERRFGSSCTASCAGLASCPGAGQCVRVGATDSLCLARCDTDATCRARNANHVCEDFDFAKLCFPNCVSNGFVCPQTGRRCNVNTGHCE